MRRKSPSLPTCPGSVRARRRVVLCAEPLESRQLLSVAAMAMPQAIAPIAIVPAAIGPIVPTAAAGAATSASAASNVAHASSIVLEFFPISGGASSFQGFSEMILIFGQPETAPIVSATSPMTGANGPVSGPGSGSAGSEASSTSAAITPLTATILTSPGVANRGPLIAIVTAQPALSYFSPSSIPVTTQAILATAAAEEQPIMPPVLGQGFESGQTQGLGPQKLESLVPPLSRVPFEPQLPSMDYIEPIEAAPETPAAPQPGQPPAPAAPPAIDPLPIMDLVDDPGPIVDRSEAPELPIPAPRVDDPIEAATPSFSMAAMVGTAAIVGGGYRLVLRRSNRFNQRWIPERGPSPMNRGRRNQDN